MISKRMLAPFCGWCGWKMFPDLTGPKLLVTKKEDGNIESADKNKSPPKKWSRFPSARRAPWLSRHGSNKALSV